MRTSLFCKVHRLWRVLRLAPAALLSLLAMASMPAQATYPVQIGFTLEGCRLETGATYDQTTFTCTDEGYVTGNLGKQWNELDYVPHRVTLKNGGGAQTFDFNASGDYTPNSISTIGWDDITDWTLNTKLSDATCKDVVTAGPFITPGGGGAGGAYQTIYREVQATMAPGETCVYDYAQRLSLGASEFSGSSLQSNLWNEDFNNSNIGQRRIQLPVADILPQELNKNMTAQQDTYYTWSLSKVPDPGDLSFQNSCERDDPMTEKTKIRIEWKRLEGAPGEVVIVTNIYAFNPAHLDVLVSVEDKIYGDSGLLDTHNVYDVEVPAGKEVLVMEHKFDAPWNVSGLNDVATATYKIKTGNIPIPGETVAYASADIQPRDVFGATASITDVEGPILGDGWMFSVDSVNGAAGAFTDYVGGKTYGPVTWKSTDQTGDGYVEFVKTIYLDMPRNGNGSLPDVATLKTDNFEVSKNAAVTFADYPMVELTIHKTIDDVLQGSETASFDFDIYVDGESEPFKTVSINFAAGETDKYVVVDKLDPNVTYRVVEASGTKGFEAVDPDQTIAIGVPKCFDDLYFVNEAEPASAKVIKVTVPDTADPSGFEFVLTGPGLPSGGVTAVSDSNGDAYFKIGSDIVELFEGNYVVTEKAKEGWVLTGITPPAGGSIDMNAMQCKFSVDLPSDADYEFLCTFENTKLATIIVTKRVVGNNALDLTGNFSFDSTVGSFDSLLDAKAWNFPSDPDSGAEVSHTFSGLLPGNYDVTEFAPPAFFNLTDILCVDPSVDTQVNTVTRTADIALAAGETVECTFVNTKLAAPGNLIIYKKTIGDVGKFDYVSVDESLPPFSLTTTTAGVYTSTSFNGLDKGLYKAKELVPAGWDLTDLYCKDDREIYDKTTWDKATGEVIVSIDDGETVSCYYVNTGQGRIIVDKVTDPANDPQLFLFTPSYGDPFKLADATEPHDSGYLTAGEYSVSESVPSGWDLKYAQCSDGSDPSKISLSAGETVTCTFKNVKRGHIIVDKVTDPANDPQEFLFTPNYGDPFKLADATAPHDSGALQPGEYSVSESVPSGWDLKYANCSDGSDPSKISLSAGETVTCTFKNVKRGHIIVDKVTDPANDPQEFLFTPNYGDPFKLADATTPHDSGALQPGVYSVSETVPYGWDLKYANCSDGSDPSKIYLSAGETVKCTFKNVKRSKIVITKRVEGNNGLDLSGQFYFDSSVGSFDALLASQTWHFVTDVPSGSEISRHFGNLVHGSYDVTEAFPPAFFNLTSIYCDDKSGGTSVNVDQRKAVIGLAPGETVECTFVNTKLAAPGNLIIYKTTIGDIGSFNFSSSDQSLPSFSIATSSENVATTNLSATFNGLPAGYYRTKELVPTGWDLTGLYCVDNRAIEGNNPTKWTLSTGEVVVSIDDGETVSCYYTDTKRGMADVLKTVNGGLPDGYGFYFQIRKGASPTSGGTLIASAFTDPVTGYQVFTCANGVDSALCVNDGGMAKILPGDYQFCELNIMPGWDNTGTDGNGNPLVWFTFNWGTTGGECANFTLDPGETESFDVDNMPPPGGNAKTIGFWKNWTSCDGKGNQYQKYLNDPERFTILDANLPITLYDGFTIAAEDPYACEIAVDLLDKRGIGDKSKVRDAQKRAGDKAYGLAAQYIAALLNVNAEAKTCPALFTALDEAAALLKEINFTGWGSYLQKYKGSKLEGVVSQSEFNDLVKEANRLAGILDDYNNNQLCHF